MYVQVGEASAAAKVLTSAFRPWCFIAAGAIALIMLWRLLKALGGLPDITFHTAQIAHKAV